MNILASVVEWLNMNQGLLAVILFVAAGTFGWISGIFSALRRRPRFRLGIIDGPSFVSVLATGNMHGIYPAHRTCVAVYLQIANIGAAPGSVKNISLAYHWCLRPLSINWFRYSIGWFWIRNQTVSITDFQVSIGDDTKFYPFLTQVSSLIGKSAETYLGIGQITNGVVYFEQSESYGGCFPMAINKVVKILIEVTDSFGGRHRQKFYLPRRSLAEARVYNPNFGLTISTLNSEAMPIDLPTDIHGNLIPPGRIGLQT